MNIRVTVRVDDKRRWHHTCKWGNWQYVEGKDERKGSRTAGERSKGHDARESGSGGNNKQRGVKDTCKARKSGNGGGAWG